MNKTNITNLMTLLLTIYGYLSDNYTIFMIGLFALSGAVTNTLAIHMLFEKVPFLYGSGVIEKKFDAFKNAIHNLLMNEFFTKENLNNFFKEEVSSKKNIIDFEQLLSEIDFTPAYDSLKEAVVESSFGSMLGMFGGETALEPLKKPFIGKLKLSLIEISKSDSFLKLTQKSLSTEDLSEDIYEKLSKIVNARLDELTPKMVKEIIQNMIKEHLAWLVIWGAVFGGLIGLISTLVI